MTTPTTAPERVGAGLMPYAPTARFSRVGPQRALMLPLAFTLVLGAFGVLPSAQENPRLLGSLLVTGAALIVWNCALMVTALRRGRLLALEVVLRKQHYLQACAQGSVLIYWGWHWRQVYDSAELIAAQLVFAYAFDMLLTWSRRDKYTLGFGPFPIIFSINLFLWFKPQWFYMQFLMVAVGFAAKEMIRWNKEGRQVHVFNPSSFPLAVFSLGLILTGTTHRTWGQEIATTLFSPQHIYVMIFLVGLPGQFFFGVTPMTMSAVVTTYAFGLLYFAVTGTYYFFDSYIPIAVFLGMHLLFTDPSTSPRTELGRIIFGMLYGLGVISLAGLLGYLGAATFFDKLLPVPILNLMIKRIDRVARSSALKNFDPEALGGTVAPRMRNLAYMSAWTIVFVIMSAVQGVGDTHRGHWVPFWQQACREGRPNACRNLAVMEATYCDDGSGWACNELGIHLADAGDDTKSGAVQSFQRSCALGFLAGCDNLKISATGAGSLRRLPPRLEDYSFVLREGKGPLPDRTPLDLYQRACTQGWADGCNNLAQLYWRGEWTPRDPVHANQYQRRACELGMSEACANLSDAERR